MSLKDIFYKNHDNTLRKHKKSLACSLQCKIILQQANRYCFSYGKYHKSTTSCSVVLELLQQNNQRFRSSGDSSLIKPFTILTGLMYSCASHLPQKGESVLKDRLLRSSWNTLCCIHYRNTAPLRS